MEPTFPFKCALCATTTYRLSELRGASGGWTTMFDWDTAIYTAVSCTGCRHTIFFDMAVPQFKQRYNIE